MIPSEFVIVLTCGGSFHQEKREKEEKHERTVNKLLLKGKATQMTKGCCAK